MQTGDKTPERKIIPFPARRVRKSSGLSLQENDLPPEADNSCPSNITHIGVERAYRELRDHPGDYGISGNFGF